MSIDVCFFSAPPAFQYTTHYQEFLRDATRVQRSQLLQNHPDLFRLECLNLQGQLQSICASSEEIVGHESASSTAAKASGLDSKVEGTHTSANLSFVTLVGTGIAKSHTLLRKLRLRLKKHGTLDAFAYARQESRRFSRSSCSLKPSLLSLCVHCVCHRHTKLHPAQCAQVRRPYLRCRRQ